MIHMDMLKLKHLTFIFFRDYIWKRERYLGLVLVFWGTPTPLNYIIWFSSILKYAYFPFIPWTFNYKAQGFQTTLPNRYDGKWISNRNPCQQASLACLNGLLKTIIAILEYYSEDGTKLRPDIVSAMVAEAARNNHVHVVSHCLSNEGPLLKT